MDVYNDTDLPQQLHWHGQMLPADIDGAAEEGTPPIPARGHRRIGFSPGPSGLRFYHAHGFAGADFQAGTYSGQVGLVYIEPQADPGAYDQERFLVLKEFSPSLTHVDDMIRSFLVPSERDPSLETMGETAYRASLARGLPHGFEVEYADLTINGRGLTYGDPIRVKARDRVLFHVLNASATEIRSLALPGHTFDILALDGNPVPVSAGVPVLWLGPGERVSASVRMSRPGVWIMGDADEDRARGMGIIVEYAGASGPPQWLDPPSWRWDYTRFGRPSSGPSIPDDTIDMVFREENAAIHGFNRWLINDVAFSMAEMAPRFRLQRGRRYRLRMRNASNDIHPIHLHRHTFELTKVAGRPTSGVVKEDAMIGPYAGAGGRLYRQQAWSLSLFHCHMQLHMDYGFMALFDCR